MKPPEASENKEFRQSNNLQQRRITDNLGLDDKKGLQKDAGHLEKVLKGLIFDVDNCPDIKTEVEESCKKTKRGFLMEMVTTI